MSSMFTALLLTDVAKKKKKTPKADSESFAGHLSSGKRNKCYDTKSKCNKREFSSKERERLAGTGAAMSDGSFPIQNGKDLSNAIQAVGRAKNYAAAKAHIIRRAKALGLTKTLPEDWK